MLYLTPFVLLTLCLIQILLLRRDISECCLFGCLSVCLLTFYCFPYQSFSLSYLLPKLPALLCLCHFMSWKWKSEEQIQHWKTFKLFSNTSISFYFWDTLYKCFNQIIFKKANQKLTSTFYLAFWESTKYFKTLVFLIQYFLKLTSKDIKFI